MTMQWLSIVEFARHFNISDMTVRRRIKTGKLQAVLREGKYYIASTEGSQVDASPSQFPPPLPPRQPSPERLTFPAATQHPPVMQAAPPLVAPTPLVVAKAIPVPHPPAHNLGGDNTALVEFCNAALTKFGQAEERIKASYQNALAALEEKVKHLEAQLQLSREREARCKQEVQDLQLLLQMMEEKPSPR